MGDVVRESSSTGWQLDLEQALDQAFADLRWRWRLIPIDNIGREFPRRGVVLPASAAVPHVQQGVHRRGADGPCDQPAGDRAERSHLRVSRGALGPMLTGRL